MILVVLVIILIVLIVFFAVAVVIIVSIRAAYIIQLILCDDHGICISHRNDLDKISVRIHKGMLQILDQLVHIAVSSLCVFLGTFQNDLFKAVRDVRYQLRGRRDLLLQVLHGHLHRGVTVEGNLPCHHLVQRDADGVDVALLVAVTAPCLLR